MKSRGFGHMRPTQRQTSCSSSSGWAGAQGQPRRHDDRPASGGAKDGGEVGGPSNAYLDRFVRTLLAQQKATFLASLETPLRSRELDRMDWLVQPVQPVKKARKGSEHSSGPPSASSWRTQHASSATRPQKSSRCGNKCPALQANCEARTS